MARRSDHTRDEIREMAIRAGKKLVEEAGLTGLSARKIAKSIGYTVGTLYNIFDNYDHIILHINAVTLDEIHGFMSRKLEAGLAGREAVQAVAESYITFATENTHRWNLLYTHIHPPERVIPEWYTEKITKLFATVEEVLLPLVHDDQKKAERCAKVLWASIHGITALGLTGKLDVVRADSIPVLTNSLIEMYMTALEGE